MCGGTGISTTIAFFVLDALHARRAELAAPGQRVLPRLRRRDRYRGVHQGSDGVVVLRLDRQASVAALACRRGQVGGEALLAHRAAAAAQRGDVLGLGLVGAVVGIVGGADGAHETLHRRHLRRRLARAGHDRPDHRLDTFTRHRPGLRFDGGGGVGLAVIRPLDGAGQDLRRCGSSTSGKASP